MKNLLLFFFSRGKREKNRRTSGQTRLTWQKTAEPSDLAVVLEERFFFGPWPAWGLGWGVPQTGSSSRSLWVLVTVLCYYLTQCDVLSFCDVSHTYPVSILGEDSLSSRGTRADAGSIPSLRPASDPKNAPFVKGVTRMVTGPLVPQWRKCHFPFQSGPRSQMHSEGLKKMTLICSLWGRLSWFAQDGRVTLWLMPIKHHVAPICCSPNPVSQCADYRAKAQLFYTCWIEEMLIVPRSWSCGSADSLDKQAMKRQHSLWNFA